MSFFSQNTDRKQRVLQNLRDAILAIEDGRVEILEEIMLNSKSDGMGYTKHGSRCDSMFFGFEYLLRTKPQPVTKPAVAETTPCTVSTPMYLTTDLEPAGSAFIKPDYDAKLSNVQLERMKVNGAYTCTKCKKFTTDSSMGMKKHYNRCGT